MLVILLLLASAMQSLFFEFSLFVAFLLMVSHYTCEGHPSQPGMLLDRRRSDNSDINSLTLTFNTSSLRDLPSHNSSSIASLRPSNSTRPFSLADPPDPSTFIYSPYEQSFDSYMDPYASPKKAKDFARDIIKILRDARVRIRQRESDPYPYTDFTVDTATYGIHRPRMRFTFKRTSLGGLTWHGVLISVLLFLEWAETFDRGTPTCHMLFAMEGQLAINPIAELFFFVHPEEQPLAIP